MLYLLSTLTYQFSTTPLPQYSIHAAVVDRLNTLVILLLGLEIMENRYHLYSVDIYL